MADRSMWEKERDSTLTEVNYITIVVRLHNQLQTENTVRWFNLLKNDHEFMDYVRASERYNSNGGYLGLDRYRI